MSSKRMTANPIKAPRYRPGKAVAEEPSSSEEEDGSDEEGIPQSTKPSTAPPKATTAKGITSSLSRVDLNERRKIAAAKEAVRVEEEKALRAKAEEGFVTDDESEEEGSEEGSGLESSEEESSEEEVPRRILLRPTFIKKDKRNKGVIAAETKTEEELMVEEEERRKAAADEIVEEQIRKDLAAKEAGKKNWDDVEGDEDEIDDTDDLDPEAGYAAWKLRELKRIKRDREAIEEREKEREEIERRKNLTEEERNAEDEEYIAKQKEEKDGKGKMGFMQKYYHKGAFYQDDAKEEGLDRRDIMGSRFVDDVNRELLPQALQMRDMTKLGKKGATKYKDLKTEDTGSWGRFDDRPRRPGPDGFNGDDRFKPDSDRDRFGGSGANNMPVGERRNVTGAPQGPRATREERGQSRDDSNTYRPTRGRSRSRSPRYEDRNRRKRSRSRDSDRYHEGGKRRRVDSR